MTTINDSPGASRRALWTGRLLATNLRAGSPLFAGTLFPVYFGIVLWAGFVLRDRSVLGLIAVRRRP